MPDGTGDDDDGYRGPATLTVDGREVPVLAILDARHEPQDGKLHWFGRVALDGAADPGLHAALTAPTSHIALNAGGSTATARVGDVDPWGRYRVTGVGTPPFPLTEPPLDS
ncbi:DUF4873 domain-containing protein [Pseudonocardia xinjiangensis]|uniref:DUF4873 domain-containing protein n=1 Tax=Pseudonocardia xinjiangensis TaxID=75289 RepID=UPI003D91592F